MEAGEGSNLVVSVLGKCLFKQSAECQGHLLASCYSRYYGSLGNNWTIWKSFWTRKLNNTTELLSYWLLFICFRKMTVGLLSNLKTTTSNTGELPQHLRVPQVILIIEYSLENIYKCHTPTQWAVITGLTSNWASHPTPWSDSIKPNLDKQILWNPQNCLRLPRIYHRYLSDWLQSISHYSELVVNCKIWSGWNSQPSADPCVGYSVANPAGHVSLPIRIAPSFLWEL